MSANERNRKLLVMINEKRAHFRRIHCRLPSTNEDFLLNKEAERELKALEEKALKQKASAYRNAKGK